MAEVSTLPSTNDKSDKSYPIPTLEVGIGTVVAAIANQIEGHPGFRNVLTSAAPLLGLGIAFAIRLVASLVLRQITIAGAKKTYDEIQAELDRTPPDRKVRIKELEKQLDDARATLKSLRTAKISLKPE